jgi:small subunit ribosomal protein S4
LERRLDNIVYRAGLATSRDQARQLVTHGHFLVNERRVNIPSFLVRAGDVVQLKPPAQQKSGLKQILAVTEKQMPPSWIERRDGTVRLLAKPNPQEIEHKLQMHLIVEFYSR